MFKKRAQAAMEFLMTYGWAILVVLAAIGALAYFGVLSPGNLLPQKCEFTSGFDCTEAPDADATAGTITFPITNSLGYEINTIALDSSSNCLAEAGIASVDPLSNGDSAIITLSDTCGLGAGDRFKEDVIVTYVSAETGMTHTATGLISGKAR